VAELIDTLLRTRIRSMAIGVPPPQTALAKQYGSERLAAACQRALAIHGASYTSVHSILKNRLDRVPAVVDHPPANVVPLLHPNLRGTIYYQQPLLDA
jgi:hypothetical protein